MVVMGSHAVFGNMKIVNVEFIISEGAKRIHETHLAFADGFDFGAREHDAGCKILKQEVLEVSLLVFDADGFCDRGHSEGKGREFFIMAHG